MAMIVSIPNKHVMDLCAVKSGKTYKHYQFPTNLAYGCSRPTPVHFGICVVQIAPLFAIHDLWPLPCVFISTPSRRH